MTILSRAGWLLSAIGAGALALSLLNVHFTGWVPFWLLVASAVVCAVRPQWGLSLVAALVPIAWYGASQVWNAKVAWAEALVLAALAGLGADAVRSCLRVPRALAVPAVLFGAIVTAGLAAGVDVIAVREGPDIWHELNARVAHEFFVDHSQVAVHAGMLLLEGLLLFAHAARLGTRAGALRALGGATAIGAALASACTLLRLGEAAARGVSFWPSLLDLAGRLRWNVHYADVNAAGSFFAMALLVAVGLAWTSAGARRALWCACGVLAAAALWLTSSRIAVLAVPAAAAAALLLPRAIAGRRQAIVAGIAGGVACALLVLLAIVLPQRGIQKSSLVAFDVRLGLIQTGARMIAAYPAFGIGLGEFQQRSGEFSSPQLLAAFPAAVHENAHNNVVQVAAETGIAGGLAFAWTILAALLVTARRATGAHDRMLQLVFAALSAFVLTMMAGHPLLIPEAGYSFWLLAGVAGGAAIGDRAAQPGRRRTIALSAAALTVIAATLPLRLAAAVRDADLEHTGIGVSQWQMSPDGIRYREAGGEATLFVPPGAFKLSINPRAASAVRVELVVDGRVANVLDLEPNHWNDLVVAARTTQSDARYRRMDLRTIGNDRPPLWITKDEPIIAR
jgi:O-antigen ligase